MLRFDEIWNVDGPNQYCNTAVRIKYSWERDGSDDLLLSTARQIAPNLRLFIEKKNSDTYLVVEEKDASFGFQLLRLVDYVLERIHANPSSDMRHIIAEATAPVYSLHDKVIFGVTGTNGKTSVVNLIYRLLLECSVVPLRLGKVDSLDVRIDGMEVGGIVHEQYDSARHLLSREIDAAVIEMTRKGIWQRGLPAKRLSCGVITNISNDHIGTFGTSSLEDLLAVKSVVVKNADVAVLNYNDRRLRELAKHLEKVCFFSSADIPQGESASVHVTVDRNIILTSAVESSALLNLSEIPYTNGGKYKHNTDNVLAAIAAVISADSVKIDLNKLSMVLSSLDCNDLVLGRFNHYNLNKRSLILDYAHNPDGVRNIANSIIAAYGRKLSCLVSIDENRNHQFCREMAIELAAGFDPVCVKSPDPDCRCSGGITIDDLIAEMREAVPDINVVLTKDPAYESYIESIPENDTGVILGAGLGDVRYVHNIISRYTRF